MAPEATHAESADEDFTVDHIPGLGPVELKHGDILLPDSTAIAEIFQEQADHIPAESSIKLATKALRQAGYGLLQIPGKLTTLHGLGKTSIPNDREYVRMRNDKAQVFVEDFIGRFVSDESSVHGIENLAPALEASRNGEPVLMMGNHGSEVDPVLCSILLSREQQRLRLADQPNANAAAEAREKLLAVIGHKVMLEKFRRTFSGAIHSLFTIASKYRNGLTDDEEKNTASAYVDNVNTILRLLITNPEYFVMLFPEGGRTRDNQIGMQMEVIRAACGKMVLPTFIDTPDKFLELEQGEKMHLHPETVDLYIGEPFVPESASATRGMSQFVGTFRENLSEVGAPVDDYTWGYMKRGRRNGDAPREMTFEEVT